MIQPLNLPYLSFSRNLVSTDDSCRSGRHGHRTHQRASVPLTRPPWRSRRDVGQRALGSVEASDWAGRAGGAGVPGQADADNVNRPGRGARIPIAGPVVTMVRGGSRVSRRSPGQWRPGLPGCTQDEGGGGLHLERWWFGPEVILWRWPGLDAGLDPGAVLANCLSFVGWDVLHG
jgi:hypothetical protein